MLKLSSIMNLPESFLVRNLLLYVMIYCQRSKYMTVTTQLSGVCERSPMKMAKIKTIVDESSMFSVITPSVAKLAEALKSAQSWSSKVASMLVGDY